MKKIFKKRISKIVIMTLIANLLFSNIMPITANAISGTLTYSGANDSNVGQIIYDGTSQNGLTTSDVSGIGLKLFNSDDPVNLTPKGSFVYFNNGSTYDRPVLGPISETSGNVAVTMPPEIFVIKSDDGSEFSFNSIYVIDATGNENYIKVEGFRDNTSTGSVELAINQTDFQETFTSTVLTPEIFQNVDEVRITNPHEVPLAMGNWAEFGDISVGDPVVETPELTNSVSFSDPTGIANNNKTKINIGGSQVAGTSYKYCISSDSNSVARPGFGESSDGFIPVVDGDMIQTENGKHIGVVKVDQDGKVLEFSDLTAVISNEVPSEVSNITLTDNDNNEGIDGRDFSVGFTDSADDKYVANYKVYIYKSGEEPQDKSAFNELSAENKVAVKTISRTVAADGVLANLGSALITDSRGQMLAGGDYVVVITDEDSTGAYSFAKIAASQTITADDKTPPVWSTNYPQNGTVTVNSADIKVKADEAGNAYYVCLPSGAQAPTAEQVKAGKDSNGVAASLNGQVILSANTENTISISSLTAGTDYDFFVVAEDSKGNLQSSVITLTATTSTDPVDDFALATKTANTVTLNWSMVTGATGIKIEQSSDNGLIWTEAATGIIASNATSSKVTGLSENTDYMFRLVVTGGQNAGTSNVVTEKTNMLPYVESVSVPANAVYIVGQNLDFTVNYSEEINIVGTPRLAILIGGVTKYANYISGAGSNTLLFRYTVQSEDFDNNGIDLGTAILNNGATLKNAVNEEANLNLTNIASTTSVMVDGVVPKITSVIAPSSKTYKSGEILSFTVNYDQSVFVTLNGTDKPYIDVNIGTKVVRAQYDSGTGTSILKFTYIVQSGDEDKNGIDIGSNIILNNCSIKDFAGNTSVTTLDGVENTSSVLVDSIAPIWESTYPKLGTITKSSIAINVKANESGNAYFVCLPKGSAEPTVQNVRLGQDANGALVGTTFRGIATISAGVENTLTANFLETATDYDIYVVAEDSIGNLQSSLTKLTATTSTDQVADFAVATKTANTVTLNWSMVTGATGIKIEQSSDNGLNWTEAATGIIASNSTSSKVTGLSENTDYMFRLVVTGGQNAGTSNIVTQKTNMLPYVESVAVPAGGVYKLGENLDFTVNYNEIVNVTGTPSIEVIVGGTTKHAEYLLGTGTQSLIFRYTVQSGDLDVDGMQLSSNMLPSGGTLKSTSDENAKLYLNNIADTTSVKIDAIAPIWASIYPKLGTITKNTIDITVKANESGNAYFVCLPKGSAEPTVQNVRLGQDANGALVGPTFRGIVAISAGVENTLTANFLETATDYDIYVVAEDSIGNLQSSLTKLTATTSTDQVADFAVATKTANTVTLNWSMLTGATGIKIEQSSDNGLSWTEAATGIIASNATTAKVTGLSENTDYMFRLVVTGGQNAGTSNIVTQKTNMLPYVESVAVPADGVYKLGENLDFTVNYNEIVNVLGTPSIEVTVGGTTKHAEYLLGAGTQSLIFRYTVQSGDLDTNGVEIPVGTLIAGGAINNLYSENANLTLNNIDSTSVVKVDGIIPTFTGEVISADRKEITLRFSENILDATADGIKSHIAISNDEGVIYSSLADDANVSINGKEIKITFASNLKGSKNRIKIAENSLEDEALNKLIEKIETSNIGTSFNAVGDRLFNENNLNEGVLNLSIDGDSFLDTNLDKANFKLNNAPFGTSIKEISYIDSTHCKVTLGYDGTDFDQNINNFSITVNAAELVTNVAITSNEISIAAIDDKEAISINNPSVIKEGEENAKIIKVTLNGGQFVNNITANNWSVTNLPVGVTKGTVTRINANTVEIALSGNSTTNYNSDINNVTVSCSAAEYTDSNGGASLEASTGVTITAKTLATVTTSSSVTGIKYITATVAGKATNEGNGTIGERGIVYSQISNPEVGAQGTVKVVAEGTTIGDFTVNLTGLTPNTIYHTRAYVQNEEGISYGSDVIFKTEAIPAPKTVDTGTVVGKDGEVVKPLEVNVVTEANDTYTASIKSEEALVIKNGEGTTSLVSDYSKLGFNTASNSNVVISADGKIEVKNLEKGHSYAFDVTYQMDGQKIVIGTMKADISANGDVTFEITLIDPYGVITDANSGEVIQGANVVLYYADTDRNKLAGKTPDTEVNLPIISGFKPNDNKNPQISDNYGSYAFMVFPHLDYYIVSTKDGYDKYISPTISVEDEIVRWDFVMKSNTKVTQTTPSAQNLSESKATNSVNTGSSVNMTIWISACIISIAVVIASSRKKKDLEGTLKKR